MLRRTQFGNPVLRTKTQELTVDEIKSKKIQAFIADLKETLESRKFGVGLAAPQVGKSLAITIVSIRPTPVRPKAPKLKLVLVNPIIVKRRGEETDMWEGCLSLGTHGSFVFAKARRYKNIRLQWLDEQGERHVADFEGLAAQVIQHEVDHLNGILFVDRVTDNTTFMSEHEYRKMLKTTDQS